MTTLIVRVAALEAEAAAKRRRNRPKGYLGCMLGLSIGIAGLAAAREAEVLAAWRASRRSSGSTTPPR